MTNIWLLKEDLIMNEAQDNQTMSILKTLGPWAAGFVAVGSLIWSLSNSISAITTTLNFHSQEIEELQKANVDQLTSETNISEQLAQVQQQLADIRANTGK